MIRNLHLALMACLLGIALPSSPSLASARTNWNTHVVQTAEGGHKLGNPDAKVRLIAFVSYTCPACAKFEQEADGAMRIAYVAPGMMSIEVRHFIRDPIDLTAALAAQCGPKDRFFLNHAALMHKQPQWLKKAQEAPASARLRWRTGSDPQRMKAIAHDMGFHEIMASRGVDRMRLNACLADTAKARKIAADSAASADSFGVAGTPSFVLDGQYQPGVHSWTALRPLIAERLKPDS